MPQERRCAFRPIVTQRAALTVHTSLHSHIMEALTTHHLISSRLVKQLTKHSLYPFLKSDPSPHLPARVSSAFHIHEPMRTDNHRQPWGVAAIQPSSHPPSLSDDLSSVCVCLSAQPYRNAPAWNLQLQLQCSPALRCKAQVVV
jgi:hypothetical protein